MTLVSDLPTARRVLPIDTETPAEIDFGPGDDPGGGGDDGGDDGSPWVTVATFVEPIEAHLARARLEQEEIPAIILDEHTAGTAWHYALAVGGAKLQVPESRAERARQILALPGRRGGAMARGYAPGGIECPHCGSSCTAPVRFTSRRMVGLVLLTVVALGVHWLVALGVLAWCICSMMMSGDRTCRACGCDWFIRRPDGGRGFDVITDPPAPRAIPPARSSPASPRSIPGR
jgi:hypothetical protein